MKKMVNGLLVATKIFLSIIIIAILMNWTGVVSIKNVFTYHLANYNELSILKDYVICDFNITREQANDDAFQYLLGEKCKKLFDIENKKDGIYISVENWLDTRTFLRPNDLKELLNDPSHEHFFVNNFIKINNNYLKYNPIIDTSNATVDMSWAENEDKMYALVPEKYKEHESNILRGLKEYYSASRSLDRNMYLKAIGEKMEDITNRDVEIIYVKDNQTYINYYSNWGVAPSREDRMNFIPDPIALIVNPVNMGNDTYLGAFSKGTYKIKKVDNSVDEKVYSNLFAEVGIEVNNQFNVTDSYKFTVNTLYKSALVTLLPILLVLLICFIQSKLYSKRNKSLNDTSLIGIIKRKIISLSSYLVLTFVASFFAGFYVSVSILVITTVILTETLLTFLMCKQIEKKDLIIVDNTIN